MAVVSASLLVYRRTEVGTDFLLGHPGGPLWARQDISAWVIPKGAVEPGEEPLQVALRNFKEETGLTAPAISHALSLLRQSGGKRMACWCAEADLDLRAFSPGHVEWESRSGRPATFRKLDGLGYFDWQESLRRVVPSQASFIQETIRFLDSR